MGGIELSEFKVLINISVSVNNKPEQHSSLLNLKIVFQWLCYCGLLQGLLLEAVLRSPHNLQHAQNCGPFAVDECMVKKTKKNNVVCDLSQ